MPAAVAEKTKLMAEKTKLKPLGGRVVIKALERDEKTEYVEIEGRNWLGPERERHRSTDRVVLDDALTLHTTD